MHPRQGLPGLQRPKEAGTGDRYPDVSAESCSDSDVAGEPHLGVPLNVALKRESAHAVHEEAQGEVLDLVWLRSQGGDTFRYFVIRHCGQDAVGAAHPF